MADVLPGDAANSELTRRVLVTLDDDNGRVIGYCSWSRLARAPVLLTTPLPRRDIGAPRKSTSIDPVLTLRQGQE